jgi:hypothetical protein
MLSIGEVNARERNSGFCTSPLRKRDKHVSRPTNDFSRTLSLTAAARMNAAQRLVEVDARITLLNVCMAFFIIALTITPKFIDMPFTHRNWFEFLTIVLAILLLAFILLQFSAKNSLRAEQFHRSGLEIQEIQRMVHFKGFNVSEREFHDMSKRFDEILQRYSLKHEPIDQLRARLEQSDDFRDRPVERRFAQARVWLASSYPLLLASLIAGSILITLLSAV